MFSKVFLIWNHQFGEADPNMLSIMNSSIDTSRTVKMCQTVLAKYTLEKWKISLPVLKAQREKKLKAERFYL